MDDLLVGVYGGHGGAPGGWFGGLGEVVGKEVAIVVVVVLRFGRTDRDERKAKG